jgi:hypothetical protein
MKKIFTTGLFLNLFFLVMIQNYCFGHSSLNSDYYAIGEKISFSKRHANKGDVLESFKEESNYRFREKLVPYKGAVDLNDNFSSLGLLIEYDDLNEINLISNNKNPSNLINIEYKSNELGYSPGEKVTLIAEPNAGFIFLNWTIDGQEISKNSTFEYTITSNNVSIQGNFKKESAVEPGPVAGTGLLEGLVAFYEMNTNLSGALKDSHGENHGTSTQIIHVNGFAEKGNKYDGKSSISSVPTSNGLNLTTEFTLMADIFREGNGQASSSIIIGKTFSSAWPENQTYSIAITKDNKIRIRTNTSGLQDWVSTKTVPLGKWVRVIATYKSGEGYSLYLDTVDAEKSSQISGSIAKSELELTIGSASSINNAAYARRFEGVLDNVGIWNRRLSKAEIEELITTKITYPDFGKVQVENVAPTVSITGPTANAQFTQGDNISITANAADTDGTITKVEFFNGSTLLGTDTTSPYSFAWTNLAVGSFTLTAKATDDKGTVTVSAGVSINVTKSAETLFPAPGTRLLEGLVAFYEMNTNLIGALKDSHGQNHGTSTQIIHVNGFAEKGNKYDGKSSISSVPNSNILNLTTEFTLMADIFREGNGQASSSIIIGKTFSSAWPENQTYSMAITKDNKIRIRTNTTGLQDWVSTKTVPLGKWVRVIATYKSGEGYRLYLDTVDAEKSSQISGSIAKSDQELTIGSASLLNNAAYSRRFEGVLDNVGIWNRQLSKAEIEELIITKISYPDFKSNNAYRITMMSQMEELPVKIIASSSSKKAVAGEKLIFLVEKEEEGVVFDYWSIDGVLVTDQTLFELEMPEKDITLTKHFRKFVAPEIKIVLPDQQYEFEAFSEVQIELESKSNDAKIEKIELFNGEDLVGKLTQGSTLFNWKNIPEGSHKLVARITDKKGNSYYSDPVLLTAIDSRSKDKSNARLEYVIGPNPTTDYLNIIFTNLDGNYNFEFRIVSMNGSIQKTFETRPEESTVTIDVSDFINGVYVLQLTANGYEVSSKKFIKQ